jgi:hypothetical protein
LVDAPSIESRLERLRILLGELDENAVWGALGHLDDLRGFAGFVVATLDQVS